MVPPPLPLKSDSERLDRILFHLQRMDDRDRLRTIGGFFKGLLAFIPVLLFIWSTWYFFVHGDEIMQKITSMAAESAEKASSDRVDKLMEQLKQFQEGSKNNN